MIEKYGYPVIINMRCGRMVKKASKGNIKKDGSISELYNIKRWKYLLNAKFKISNKCCDVMKKKPAHDFDKKTGKKAILGTMADESKQRQVTWLQQGCNSFDSKRPMGKPMSFWTEQDVLHYLKDFNILYASVYGNIVAKTKIVSTEELEQLAMENVSVDLMTTGVQRTGCMFCMFGAHLDKYPNRFQRMKITHPKQYDYCMREENGLGLAKVLNFIGVTND